MSEVETSSSRLRRGAKVKIYNAKLPQLFFSSRSEFFTNAHFFSVKLLIGFIQERNSYSGGAGGGESAEQGSRHGSCGGGTPSGGGHNGGGGGTQTAGGSWAGGQDYVGGEHQGRALDGGDDVRGAAA